MESTSVESRTAVADGLQLRRDDAIGGAFVLQLFLALAVLLGGVAWWARMYARRGPANPGSQPARLRVVGALSVSPRTRLSLIEVDGERVLLSESSQGATVIHTLPSGCSRAAGPLSGEHQ